MSFTGQSDEGEDEIVKALQEMASRPSNTFSVYTCPPIMFTLIYTVGKEHNISSCRHTQNIRRFGRKWQWRDCMRTFPR